MKAKTEMEARIVSRRPIPPMERDFALTYQPHDKVLPGFGRAMYEMGWETAIAHALTLAVRFGPDNDYRLRRALIDAMDNCPTPNTEGK